MTEPTVAWCDVYGAGGHAQVVTDVLGTLGLRVRRFLNDNPERRHPATGEMAPGIRLTGVDAFPPQDLPLVMAVGRNGERAELVRMLGDQQPSPSFLRAVHPTAIVAPTATIGEGSVVLHGTVIQAGARIGSHVLVNTAASVDHDCVVGDFAHVSPHATLCGHVEVGEGTHIGAGAVVIPSVRIGRWCRVGAGAVVLRDVPDHTTVVGNPARAVPDRAGEPEPDLDRSALPDSREVTA